jgi:1-acyl-sn-glycerol-3-phosphate acyltransferase
VNHWFFAPFLLVLMYALLLVLGLMSLGWNLIAAALRPLLSRERGQTLGRAAISRTYGTFWWLARSCGLMKMDARALDVLREVRGLVVVANHPSMLDALILVARLPRSVCVMKASLMRNAFLGPGARLARYIRNDSPRSMIRLAVNDLKQGGQLVLFPEGTRTTQDPLNPFRPGFTAIAKLAEVPIQTVFIDTNSPYLGKGWPIWRVPRFPISYTVRLGQQFPPQADSNAQLRDIEAYFALHVQPRPDPL